MSIKNYDLLFLFLLVGCTGGKAQTSIRNTAAPPPSQAPIVVSHEGIHDYGPDTPGTVTDGIQEAIAASAISGRDLRIHGGRGGPVYHIRQTIFIPPTQDWKVDGGIYVMNYEGPPDSPLLDIDSCMNVDIELGILVYGGNSTAVYISPRSPVPIDGFPVFTETKLHIEGISNDSPFKEKPNFATGIILDGTKAPIVYNKFEFVAILNFSTNLRTEGTVRGNQLEIWHLHSNLSNSNLLIADPGFTKNWIRLVCGVDQGAIGVQGPLIPSGNRIEMEDI